MPYCTAIALLLLVASAGVFSHGSALYQRKGDQQLERTIAADPRVNISVCVVSGDLTVQGWDRKEVRARGTEGSSIELTRIDRTNSEAATALRLMGNADRSNPASSSCLSFGDVQLDVPREASVKLQTTTGDIRVTQVAHVNATTQSGSIALFKVNNEASVNTIGGEISARDSTGSFKLHAIGGTIDARNIGAANKTDAFSASTVGGEVSLDHVQLQTIKVNTVSGEIAYVGPLSREGGHYYFQSISGRLRLSIPSESSFRLTAALGADVKLTSDFNLKYSENQNATGVSNRGALRRVDATVGTGESSIAVSLLSGSLLITKQ